MKKLVFVSVVLSLSLTACDPQGPLSPVAPKSPAPQQENPASPLPPAAANTAPDTAGTMPASLEEQVTRLKAGQDLPLVAGRIDIRDVDASTPVTERIAGQDYRFRCDGVAETPQDVAVSLKESLLMARESGQGDSLRRDFEYVLIRCQKPGSK